MRHPKQAWTAGLVALPAAVLAALPVAVLARCGGGAGTGEGEPAFVTVTELFTSENSPVDNLDSLAFWPAGPWVLATAKATDQLVVLDARDGRIVRRLGERGDAPGQFRRPNGVAVAGDLVLVSERDNHRVQLLRLPELEPVGVFGSDVLRSPYGLAVLAKDAGELEVYVTDNYLGPGLATPPASELGERVKHFRLTPSESGFEARYLKAFGDTNGPGVLTTVESIAADARYDRLLVADETRGVQNIKVYSLAGTFTGQIIGAGLFAAEPEGIALIEHGEGGFWVATDQRRPRTVFHLFDRRDLRHLGSAVGEMTANTDGITTGPCAPGEDGRLFAVHDDRAVVAFSCTALVRALGLGTS